MNLPGFSGDEIKCYKKPASQIYFYITNWSWLQQLQLCFFLQNDTSINFLFFPLAIFFSGMVCSPQMIFTRRGLQWYVQFLFCNLHSFSHFHIWSSLQLHNFLGYQWLVVRCFNPYNISCGALFILLLLRRQISPLCIRWLVKWVTLDWF